jgi:hypothetical protein
MPPGAAVYELLHCLLAQITNSQQTSLVQAPAPSPHEKFRPTTPRPFEPPTRQQPPRAAEKPEIKLGYPESQARVNS